jgi:hypothetical protein
VFLLINGRFSDAHRFTREKNPEMFGDTAVKFDHELDVVLPGDAHLVAVAGSEKRMKTSIYGSAPEGYLSAAITNPIFVDVDGSGFQPNKDTLGAPLPVRRGD